MRSVAVFVAIVLVGCASANHPAQTGDDDDDDAAMPDGSGTPIDAGPDAAPDARIDAAPDAPPHVTEIDVTGAPQTLPKGTTAQLAATAVYSDQTMVDITATATWDSADPASLTVSAGGLVTAVAGSGMIDVHATMGTITGAASIALAPAAISSIVIAPNPLSLPLGRSQALAATATYTDNSTGDVTAQATWSVMTGTSASVSAAGLVTTTATGSSTIEAALGSATATVAVSVTPAVADHVALSVQTLSLAQHQRAHLRAFVVYSDGSQTDVTATATWAATAGATASAGGQIDAGTTATTSTITATASGFSGTATATITSDACHPVINEVQAAGATSSDEWVELYNPCTAAVDVQGWTLVYRSSANVGATDTNTLASLTGSLPAGGFLLFGGQGYAGTPALDGAAWGGGSSGLLAGANGAIGLRSGAASTGTLVDAVAYGAVSAGHPFLEGTAAPALVTAKSVARAPFDGNDTNTGGADFTLAATPTPKALND
ncbi:MAG TPA: lamin tail domain-containing protein [Kofleriaceae bacterium]|jgi:hypothetical protein